MTAKKVFFNFSWTMFDITAWYAARWWRGLADSMAGCTWWSEIKSINKQIFTIALEDGQQGQQAASTTVNIFKSVLYRKTIEKTLTQSIPVLFNALCGQDPVPQQKPTTSQNVYPSFWNKIRFTLFTKKGREIVSGHLQIQYKYLNLCFQPGPTRRPRNCNFQLAC